jgi:hypothetical protein
MARLSTLTHLSIKHVLPTTRNAAESDSARRSIRPLFPLAATLLVSLHCATALAGDIARDTPAASMALAQGLYAAPGPSAAVSSVATPVITASPLPSEAPPDKVSAAAPSIVATATAAPSPAKAPETEWINYVAVIAGIVGAITGIAGAIMGGLGLRMASRQRRRY